MSKCWYARLRASRVAGPRAWGQEVRVLRPVVAGLVGAVLLAAAVFLVAGHAVVSSVARSRSAVAPGPAGTVATASAAPRPMVSGPGAVTIPAAPSASAPVAGYASPSAVYSFLIPDDLTVRWGSVGANGQNSASLAADFRDLYGGLLEAWSFQDPRDPRLAAWCQWTCDSALQGVITSWASVHLSPVGTVRLYNEQAVTGHDGLSGAVDVCEDDSGLGATGMDPTQSADPDYPGAAVGWVFGASFVSSQGRWIFGLAAEDIGSAYCAGGG